MPIIRYMSLLVCLVFFSGCDRTSKKPGEKAPEKGTLSLIEVENSTVEDKASEKAEKGTLSMIKVENLTAEDKVLTLDYQVTNPFSFDIWICENIDIQCGCPADIRIDAETVSIKLTYRLQRNMLRSPPAYGRYLRLPSGESHSAMIRLDLPIKNISPVYDFGERRRNHKRVILHRLLFVIGYFEDGPINKLRERIGAIKRGFDSVTLNEVRRSQPIIVEETQDGQSRDMLYITCSYPGRRIEKCAEVLITDVNIPCSVIVDDE